MSKHYYRYFVFFLILTFFKAQGQSELKNTVLPIKTKEQTITFIKTEKPVNVEKFLKKTTTDSLDLAKEYYKIYMQRGVNQRNDTIRFLSYYYLGNIAYRQAEYPKATSLCDSAIKIAKILNDEQRQISALTLSGMSYHIDNQLPTALQQYLEVKKIIEKNDKFKGYKLTILANIAIVRMDIRRYDDALDTNLEIINLLEQKGLKNDTTNQETYLSALLSTGLCYHELKQYDKAIANNSKGLQYAKSYRNKNYEANFILNSGEVYLRKKLYQLALDNLLSAKTIFVDLGLKKKDPKILIANYHIAESYYAMKAYGKAHQYLEENFDAIGKDRNVGKITEMYQLAINCVEQLGDTPKQLHYSQLHRAIIDSLHNNQLKTRDILFDEDIKDLEKQNETLINTNLSKAIKIKIASILAAVLAIALISMIFFSIRNKKRNKKRYEELMQTILKKEVQAPMDKKALVTDEKTQAILQKLEALEKTSFIIDPECNLYNMARKIDTNTSYLSQIINEFKDKTFNNYLNELRINYALKKLKDENKFRSYTIKAIAQEVGYKSVNTFTTAFKKQTGLTPSFYIKEVSKEIT